MRVSVDLDVAIQIQLISFGPSHPDRFNRSEFVYDFVDEGLCDGYPPALGQLAANAFDGTSDRTRRLANNFQHLTKWLDTQVSGDLMMRIAERDHATRPFLRGKRVGTQE